MADSLQGSNEDGKIHVLGEGVAKLNRDSDGRIDLYVDGELQPRPATLWS